jgi:long-chain acyl-CoA synthetase
MNLAVNLENSALLFPDKAAIREGDVEISYRELNEGASQVATGLIGLGVRAGELVGLCAPNSISWIIFYFGVLKTGAVAVTLSNNSTAEELTTLLLHAKPRILFTTEDRVEGTKHTGCPVFLEKIICPNSGCDIDLKDLMNTGTKSFRAVDRDRMDTAVILYTGGTTGIPKGVMLTHEGINFSSRALAYYERSTKEDLALCFLPFNHVFGQIHIMNSTFLSAGCLELLPAFDMDGVLSLMESGRVTKFFSVPTIYVRLLAVPDLKRRLGKVRYCFSAGASMAQEIAKQWKDQTGLTIAESYGMTEAMPVTYNHFYPERHVVGSVGQPIHGVEVQIRDTSGHILNQGQEGEICIRGRNVMKGYLNNPEATNNALWEGQWLRSGDIGYIDENGYVYIVDRIKDLIITGGENVFPREVEEVLYCCPEVGECAVIGLPDKQWGERVTAFIIPKEGRTVLADAIKASLKGRLAPFKVPKEYVVVEDLPRSAAGKILKREVKRRYLESKG